MGSRRLARSSFFIPVSNYCRFRDAVLRPLAQPFFDSGLYYCRFRDAVLRPLAQPIFIPVFLIVAFVTLYSHYVTHA
jgi:hypothetical protein